MKTKIVSALPLFLIGLISSTLGVLGVTVQDFSYWIILCSSACLYFIGEKR